MLWTLWFLGCFRLKVWKIRRIVPLKEAQKRVDDCHVLGYKSAYVICTEVCVAYFMCDVRSLDLIRARFYDWLAVARSNFIVFFFFHLGESKGFSNAASSRLNYTLDLCLPKDRESYTSLQLFSKVRAPSRTGNKPNIFDTFFDWWKPKITIDLTLLWLINEVDFYFFSSVGLL